MHHAMHARILRDGARAPASSRVPTESYENKRPYPHVNMSMGMGQTWSARSASHNAKRTDQRKRVNGAWGSLMRGLGGAH